MRHAVAGPVRLSMKPVDGGQQLVTEPRHSQACDYCSLGKGKEDQLTIF
jgi:hypothetical protein